jgi:hypothetical protein
MGKNTAFEMPPPGAGLVTVIEAVLALATSEVLIVALSWLWEMAAVKREDPFQLTTAVGANPVPFTVRVNVELPGWMLAGTNA